MSDPIPTPYLPIARGPEGMRIVVLSVPTDRGRLHHAQEVIKKHLRLHTLMDPKPNAKLTMERALKGKLGQRTVKTVRVAPSKDAFLVEKHVITAAYTHSLDPAENHISFVLTDVYSGDGFSAVILRFTDAHALHTDRTYQQDADAARRWIDGTALRPVWWDRYNVLPFVTTNVVTWSRRAHVFPMALAHRNTNRMALIEEFASFLSNADEYAPYLEEIMEMKRALDDRIRARSVGIVVEEILTGAEVTGPPVRLPSADDIAKVVEETLRQHRENTGAAFGTETDEESSEHEV